MFPKLNSPSSSLFLKKALPSWVISDCSFPRVMGWSSLFHYLRSLPSLRSHSTAITAFPEVQASCTRALSRDYRINFLVAQLHDPHPLVQIFSVPQRLTGQRPNSPCYLKLSMAQFILPDWFLLLPIIKLHIPWVLSPVLSQLYGFAHR